MIKFQYRPEVYEKSKVLRTTHRLHAYLNWCFLKAPTGCATAIGVEASGAFCLNAPSVLHSQRADYYEWKICVGLLKLFTTKINQYFQIPPYVYVNYITFMRKEIWAVLNSIQQIFSSWPIQLLLQHPPSPPPPTPPTTRSKKGHGGEALYMAILLKGSKCFSLHCRDQCTSVGSLKGIISLHKAER